MHDNSEIIRAKIYSPFSQNVPLNPGLHTHLTGREEVSQTFVPLAIHCLQTSPAKHSIRSIHAGEIIVHRICDTSIKCNKLSYHIVHISIAP